MKPTVASQSSKTVSESSSKKSKSKEKIQKKRNKSISKKSCCSKKSNANNNSWEESEPEEEEEEYLVEKILEKRFIDTEEGKIPQYLIKWKGFSSVHNTWEPTENLDGLGLLVEYEKNLKEKEILKSMKSKNKIAEIFETDSEDEEDGENTKIRIGQADYGIHLKWPRSRIPFNLVNVLTIESDLCYLIRCQTVNYEDIEELSEENVVVVQSTAFKELFPHIVIAFYEERLLWNMRNKSEEVKPEEIAEKLTINIKPTVETELPVVKTPDKEEKQLISSPTVKNVPDNLASCHICGKEFKNQSKSWIKCHLMSCKKSNKAYRCHVPNCSMKFKRKHGLTMHLKWHADEKKISCNLCEFKFYNKIDLNLHMCAVHDISSTKNKSEDEFKSDKQLEIHDINQDHADVQVVDASGSKTAIGKKSEKVKPKTEDKTEKLVMTTEQVKKKTKICEKCGTKNFKNDKRRAHHIWYCYKEANFRCHFPNCDKVFKLKSDCVRHVQRHGKKKFLCNLCDSKFCIKTDLNSHMSKVHKIASCKTPSKKQQKNKVVYQDVEMVTADDSKARIGDQSNIQTEVKEKKCTMNSMIIQDNNLHEQEDKQRHEQEGKYHCTKCDEKFTRISRFDGHTELFHSLKPPKKIIQCTQCPRKFTRDRDLRSHKCHLNSKPNLEATIVMKNKHTTDDKKSSVSKESNQKKSPITMEFHDDSSQEFTNNNNVDPKKQKETGTCKNLSHSKNQASDDMFSCKNCCKTFKNKQKADAHRYYHKHKENLKCPSCDKQFKKTSDLDHHVKYCHNHNSKTVTDSTTDCPQCYQSFTDDNCLKIHMKQYHYNLNQYLKQNVAKECMSSPARKTIENLDLVDLTVLKTDYSCGNEKNLTTRKDNTLDNSESSSDPQKLTHNQGEINKLECVTVLCDSCGALLENTVSTIGNHVCVTISGKNY